MTRKTFLSSLLFLGIVFLCGVILLLSLVRKSKIGYYPDSDDKLPPRTPRTVEIPDEIRKKFSKIPDKPTLIAEIEHHGYIDSVAFSPIDDSLIVSNNQEDSIKL